MSGSAEEEKDILRRIVEGLAWRQIATMNMLGHCLKYVTDLDTKLRVASELDLHLRLFHDVRGLYRELGWADLDSAVRDHVGRMPLPDTRLEFGLAYHVIGVCETVAMRSYVDCSHPLFAAIALSYIEAAGGRPEPTRFVEFCLDAGNRPQAQHFVNRWIAFAVTALGRPGTPRDRRAVELGLRSRTSAEMQAEYVDELMPFLSNCGLNLPDFADLAVR